MMIDDYGTDYIKINGLGKIKTSETDPIMYKNIATIKISKSDYGPWYMIDTGKLIHNKLDKSNGVFIGYENGIPKFQQEEINYDNWG